MESKNIHGKNNLSDRVKKILHEKGFSFLFTWEEYRRYKKQAQDAFHIDYKIADLFIMNADQEGDFSNYIF